MLCCRERSTTAAANRVHEHAAPGVGEGVSLQQVPVPPPAHRDRRLPGPDGAAGEGLVPEPAHEAQATDAQQAGRRRRRQGLHGQRGRQERQARGQVCSRPRAVIFVISPALFTLSST